MIPAHIMNKWTRTAYNKNDDTTITILDPIGEDYFGEGVTASRVNAALRRIGDRPVAVIINSPGGNFFEGLAIYELLKAHTQKVTVKIMGLAASAASLVALAGDEIIIGKASMLMVHRTHSFMYGNANDYMEQAEKLLKFDSVLTNLIADKTGLETGKISNMLTAETWLTADEALKLGFATAITQQTETKEDPENVWNTLDKTLAKAGVTRSERRHLFKNIKASTRTAVSDDTHNAVVLEPLPRIAFNIK